MPLIPKKSGISRHTLYTKKELRVGGMKSGRLNLDRNKIMAGWLKNKNVKQILSTTARQQEFFNDIETRVKKDQGQLTRTGLKRVFGEYEAGKDPLIHARGARRLEHEFFAGSTEKKYILPEKENAATSDDSNEKKYITTKFSGNSLKAAEENKAKEKADKPIIAGENKTSSPLPNASAKSNIFAARYRRKLF